MCAHSDTCIIKYMYVCLHDNYTCSCVHSDWSIEHFRPLRHRTKPKSPDSFWGVGSGNKTSCMQEIVLYVRDGSMGISLGVVDWHNTLDYGYVELPQVQVLDIRSGPQEAHENWRGQY